MLENVGFSYEMQADTLNYFQYESDIKNITCLVGFYLAESSFPSGTKIFSWHTKPRDHFYELSRPRDTCRCLHAHSRKCHFSVLFGVTRRVWRLLAGLSALSAAARTSLHSRKPNYPRAGDDCGVPCVSSSGNKPQFGFWDFCVSQGRCSAVYVTFVFQVI